ncbi:hypothetical protein IIU_00258 [Bacillus cereus VD133]|uniref:Lipoprotein n=1 Tax=Bacillus cereus VD133 TaxID=1053233 RepID=A0A9W5V5F6_BACCE|nr:hypothetical protein IIU_00258 [Bacillus cereus VD133]
MSKKLLMALACSVLLMGLAACGSNDKANTSEEPKQETKKEDEQKKIEEQKKAEEQKQAEEQKNRNNKKLQLIQHLSNKLHLNKRKFTLQTVQMQIMLVTTI